MTEVYEGKYLTGFSELATFGDNDILAGEEYADPNLLRYIKGSVLKAYFNGDIEDALAVIPYFGEYLPYAGSVQFTFDPVTDNVLTSVYKNSGGDTVCTVTYTYDGDDIDYSVAVFAAPINLNIKNQYNYTGTNITSITRTLI